ncbi:MAG: hypothetical protein AAGA87_01980 [Pseudomonadota bacterium]
MWKLVLPVLIPSWRFFKAIEPSPRVQWAMASDSPVWLEFRPRPFRVSRLEMIRRLFWNPDWNDTLFVVSCAERIQENPTEHNIAEIKRRISEDVSQGAFQFRLVFVHRDGEDIVFVSDVFPLT